MKICAISTSILTSYPPSHLAKHRCVQPKRNMLANATLRKKLDNSAITQVGASVSKQIKQNKNDDSRYRSDDYAANGYVSYNTKYNAGTVSVSRSSQHKVQTTA